MKRKLLATGLLFALLLSTTACGATAESTGQDTNNDTASASEITEAEDTTAEDTTEELPQVANLELTEGVVNGNRYENDSFGVAFTLPEGFVDTTASFKTIEHLESDPGYNPDYYLPDFCGSYYFPDTSEVLLSVVYLELIPEEAAKSTVEIVKDKLELCNDSEHYSLQEYTIGDQTHYGILAYANDGGISSYRIEYVYIIRDNKVMEICVLSMGKIEHYDNSTETSEQISKQWSNTRKKS